MTGIAAVGAYAPRFRVSADAYREAWGRFGASGVESTAVPGADEDALTMACAAARRALSAGAVDGDAVAHLALATTTPPDEEEDLTARLGAMLGVDETASRQQFDASTRAGTRALAAALDAERTPALVVASDCPRAAPDDDRDHAAGAGAAALLVTADGPARVVDRGEYASPYPGTRFRQRGSDRVEGLDVTAYDREAFTEALAGAAAGVDRGRDGGGDEESEIDAAAVQAPDGKLPSRATGALGVDSDAIQACATVHDLGDTGAASVPLSLARALADGHDRVLAAGYGAGVGADVLVVEREGHVAADLAVADGVDCSYAEYLRLRGEVTSGPPDGGGAYVSVPSWRRTLAQRYRLAAGRCEACGALAFPPAGACDECGHLGEYERVALPGEGTVEAVTTISQGGAPPEFAEQQAQSGDFAVAVVAFDGPGRGDESDGDEGDESEADDADRGRVSVPAQVTDADPGSVAVGDRVVATVRRIYTQEGVTRYGFKVRPA